MKFNKLILLVIFISFQLLQVAGAKSRCASDIEGCSQNSSVSAWEKILTHTEEATKLGLQKHQENRWAEVFQSLTSLFSSRKQITHQNIERFISDDADSYITRVEFDFEASRDEPAKGANKKAATASPENNDPKFLLRAGKRAIAANQYSKAKTYLERLLDVLESKGEESVELADALHEMGTLHLDLGKYGKAAPYFLRSLSLKEKLLGKEDASVAATRAKLGSLYKAKGEFGKAESFYLRALSIYEKHTGKEEITVADIWMDLGDIYLSKRQYVKAEKFYHRSEAINIKARGRGHPVIARIDAKLAEIFAQNGDLKKAENFHLEAIVKAKKALGPEHTSVVRAMKKLADFYQSNKHYKNAEKSYLMTLSVATKAFGEKSPFVAEIRKSLSETYEFLGDHEKANALRKKSMQVYG